MSRSIVWNIDRCVNSCHIRLLCARNIEKGRMLYYNKNNITEYFEGGARNKNFHKNGSRLSTNEEEAYEFKRNESKKAAHKDTDVSDNSGRIIGHQAVFSWKLSQYVSGNTDTIFIHGTSHAGSDTWSNDSGWA